MWSQDANAECEQVITSKSFFVTPQGKNVRSIQFEVPQTFYDITKDSVKTSKTILSEVAKEMLERNGNDYTFDYICDLIGYRKVNGNRIRRYAPNDKIIIPKGALKNSDPIETTIGRLIFYKVIIEAVGIQQYVQFQSINHIFTKKEYEKFEQKITDLLVADKIDTAIFSEFINHRDWLGLQLHAVVTISFTEKTTKTPQKIKDLKEKLFEENKKELDEGNIIVANKIERELIDKMMEEIKDDPGYDLYASGARGSVDNHMKNMFIMRGGVSNPNTGKYDIMQNSFTDGLRKEDFTAASNSIVHGAYPKACG